MGLRNIFFNLKYPFWKGNYNKIPYGWRISFGKDLSKSLLKFIRKNKLKDFEITDVKKIAGRLTIKYKNGCSDIDEILNKYTILSMGFCTHCGGPVRYYVKNIYLCEDCFYNKYLPRIKDLKQKRRLIRDYKVSIDLLPENCYNVNLKNMWGLKNE